LQNFNFGSALRSGGCIRPRSFVMWASCVRALFLCTRPGVFVKEIEDAHPNGFAEN
jgi:hypothetical protein